LRRNGRRNRYRTSSVVAQVAKDAGAIVIGTVTMPFNIERARVDKAEFGLQQLRQFLIQLS